MISVLSKITIAIYLVCLILVSLPDTCLASSPFNHLFGFIEIRQKDINYLKQWISVLNRHLKQDVPEKGCKNSLFKKCHIKNWLNFLKSIKSLPPKDQIVAVNKYANQNPYVLDIINYSMEDYWAAVREFLFNGGDCEDYAIAKFFSLEQLGFSMKDIRIVILQDTNLKTSHAVMAVNFHGDLLIMDNQTDRVISHRQIAHYVPLYSLNENGWWLHMPTKMMRR